jgi:acetoin utilization protein AcuC
MNNLVIAYSDTYLNWKLGSGDGSHPTNPVRAKLAVDYLEAELPEFGVGYEIIEPTFEEGDRDRLLEVHSEQHVSMVLDTGTSAEWFGVSRSNAETAGLMFGGTVRLVEKMLSDGTRVAFNPQGAKHHAHYSKSSGFCVFNDMAWAALEFKKAGLKVAYIDWDVHAGDGVQALLAETDIPTFSIHGHGIFPNLRYTSLPNMKGNYSYIDEESHWYNYNLQTGSGDDAFAWAIDEVVKRAETYAPDVILIATGADGHEGENWGIKYTLDGYKYAAEKVAGLAEKLGSKVLIGGAGGYQPYTWTPRIWAEVVKTIGSTLLS